MLLFALVDYLSGTICYDSLDYAIAHLFRIQYLLISIPATTSADTHSMNWDSQMVISYCRQVTLNSISV